MTLPPETEPARALEFGRRKQEAGCPESGLAQMLIGVATRQYERSLEPLGADVTTRGTSKRAVSRRFVAQTQAQLDAWRATPLDALDLAVLLIDGVHVGGHCIVVALGIDKTGAKHPLGLWEGATENVPSSVFTSFSRTTVPANATTSTPDLPGRTWARAGQQHHEGGRVWGWGAPGGG